MNKMYRINYVVDTTGVSCTRYAYPILEEKNSYFVIRSGKNNRHIKKSDIGKIRNVDVDRTGCYVFLTELDNQDKYIERMIEKIKESTMKKVNKFKSIHDNANHCNIQMVEVEPE